MIPNYEAIRESTKEGFEQIIVWLKANGKEVGRRQNEEQCLWAGQIINMAYFLTRMVGSPSVGLMMGAIEDYCHKYELEVPVW